ncbi:MAG: hypothetical protein JRJ03_06530 [Deltaproteobacteria bacterium]|nr:hypothetical protein [Deltaproteobacteria bacterium]
MRILYFHTTIWHSFFSDLLLLLQHRHDADVSILCPRFFWNSYSQNVEAGARMIPWPDLTDGKSFQDYPLDVIRPVITACERAMGRSANRIILAAERDIGQGFSKGFFYWPKNPVRSFCAEDNLRPNLLLERLFAFTADLFKKTKPDLIISRDTNSPWAQSAWFLAKKEEIPFFTCRFSKMLSKRAFWTDDYFMYNTQAAMLTRRFIAEGKAPSREALAVIAGHRERPMTVDYIRRNWARAETSNWVKQHRNLMALAKQKALFYIRGAKGIQPKPILPKAAEYYRILCMKHLHAKYFRTFTDTELARMRFAYLPLHKEPELMLNFESVLWHDQRHMVKYVSSMLPAGCRLLVKEHRFNWGRRYGDYLKYLSGLPNVTLIHPFDSQFKYIQNASLIVTDNGSTGWEGLLIKKPVVTLEKTFYDAAGLSFHVPDPRALDRVMIQALEQRTPVPEQEWDLRLAAVIDAERETTLEIETMHAEPALSIRIIDDMIKNRERRIQ